MQLDRRSKESTLGGELSKRQLGHLRDAGCDAEGLHDFVVLDAQRMHVVEIGNHPCRLLHAPSLAHLADGARAAIAAGHGGLVRAGCDALVAVRPHTARCCKEQRNLSA